MRLIVILFAVQQCDISPYVLESALAKIYEYEIKNINNKKEITQERLNKYLGEMKLRKANVLKLISEFELKKEHNEEEKIVLTFLPHFFLKFLLNYIHYNNF